MNNREFFDKNGYLSVPGMITDPENLFHAPLKDFSGNRMTGEILYQRKNKFTHNKVDMQVEGALSRYNAPCYKHLHYLVMKEVETILNIDLLKSYFYDRFYFLGQDLKRHIDRPACEISVTLQISTNSNNPWPIWFQRPDGSEVSVTMRNGDAVIYKGNEREHWREPLVSKYNKFQRLWRRVRNKDDDTYHHQVFFHYVNSQGPWVHMANDK